MKNKDDRSKQADTSANSIKVLRRRAEDIVREKAAQSNEKPEMMPPEEAQQTLHELMVHQIELEMQNEELRRAQVELDTVRARYFDLYDLAPVGYLIISEKGLIQETNLTAATLLCAARGSLINQPMSCFIFKEDQDIYYLSRKKLFDTGEPQTCEIRMVKIDKTVFWGHLAASITPDAECAPICRVILSDISERKQAEEEILYLGYHDHLTGLYNRRFYEEELKRLDTKRNFPMTIVMGDINGLKLINDSFGHAMGDELLKKVAEVIKKGCRADDISARLGGDEFVIILPKTDNDKAEQIIERIKDLSLKEKIGSFNISISFGCKTKNNENENIQDVFKNAEHDMYRHKLYESSSMKIKIIELIMSTLYGKNKKEEQHSLRVSALCKRMGEVLGLPEREIEELKSVGLLHDIGKIARDENILSKQEKLTDEEWREIKRHPETGYRILSAVNEMSEMSEYVLAHHERWDGKGYPKGLTGEEISLQARILSISDSFDVMTSDKAYGKRLSKERAVAEISRCSGTQFDPNIARLFIEEVLGKGRNY